MTAAREAAQYVEPVTVPTIKARHSVQYVEVVVLQVKTGWSVGFIKGSNG